MRDLDGAPHLAEVVPSALAALGVPGQRDTLGLRPVARACVLLIDGLGLHLLREHAADAPMLNALAAGALRVGFPSTTTAGLAAIGTGRLPGEHGMVGLSFDLPGVGVINALRWRGTDSGEDLREVITPEDAQPLTTTFSIAAEAGVRASVVSPSVLKGSALTRAVHRGADFRGVHAIGDLVVETVRALDVAPAFCFAYHGDLDSLGHVFGPGSLPWRMQLRQVDRIVESIVDLLPSGAALLVVADHGMVRMDGTAADLDDTPELLAGVRAIGGEPRARHVYTKDGSAAEVLERWRGTLGDRATVLSRDGAIAAGWFGPVVTDRVRPRIGDVVAAADGGFGMVRTRREPRASAFLGHHGSLTPAEQLVPLAIAYG